MMSIAETPERRRRVRISVEKDAAIAFCGNQHGQIVNASQEGLCFQYVTSASKAAVRKVQKEMGQGTMDIVLGAYDFTLAGIPVETVADFQVSTSGTGKKKRIVRRRSFTFGKLTHGQLFSLKRFLLLIHYGEMSM